MLYFINSYHEWKLFKTIQEKKNDSIKERVVERTGNDYDRKVDVARMKKIFKKVIAD